jgi:hypothetical protein
MKLRLDRMVLLIVVFAVVGLIAGYFLFGKVLGRYVSVSLLLTGQKSGLEGIANAVRGAVLGIEEIRRNVLISGAVGAFLGLLVSLVPIEMRHGRKRR